MAGTVSVVSGSTGVYSGKFSETNSESLSNIENKFSNFRVEDINSLLEYLGSISLAIKKKKKKD